MHSIKNILHILFLKEKINMKNGNRRGGSVTEFTHRGEKFSLQGFSPDDWIYKLIKNTKGFYEIDLLSYIEYVLSGKDGVVIDVGANIGNHSVYFGSFVSKGVICFEPNPSVIPILKRNLLMNEINFNLFELGLSDEPGFAAVDVPFGHENNVGAARLRATNNTSHIEISTLDILSPQIEDFLMGREILAIKIDVEGMEAKVLKGARFLIDFYKPDIFVEIVDENQMNCIEPVLNKMGYKKIVSHAATPVWHFSHRNKLTNFRKFLLALYIVKSRIKRKFISLATKVRGFFS